jgi:hypothetical protein
MKGDAMAIACSHRLSDESSHRAFDEKRALAVAVSRVATLWNLSHNQLGGILGLSAASAARLRSNSFIIRPTTLASERGRHLLRLFHSLDCLADGNDAMSIAWLRTLNRDLHGRPIDLILSSRGLNDVIDHVSAQIRSAPPRRS